MTLPVGRGRSRIRRRRELPAIRLLAEPDATAESVTRPGHPDLRELRGGDGRAQVQAHLPLRLLPVLLGLLLTTGRVARGRRLDWTAPMTAQPTTARARPARRPGSRRIPAVATSG